MKLLIAVLPTVLLVVIGQIITKWRVNELKGLAHLDASQVTRIVMYVTDPFIVGAYGLALMSSIAWMIVIERHDISIAYPVYIGLSLGAVLAAGICFFNEPLNVGKVIALSLILVGVILAAQYS